jgi:hypothetical protein
MPRMLMDIVKDIIADEEDIALVGEVAGNTNLLQAATQTRADVRRHAQRVPRADHRVPIAGAQRVCFVPLV